MYTCPNVRQRQLETADPRFVRGINAGRQAGGQCLDKYQHSQSHTLLHWCSATSRQCSPSMLFAGNAHCSGRVSMPGRQHIDAQHHKWTLRPGESLFNYLSWPLFFQMWGGCAFHKKQRKLNLFRKCVHVSTVELLLHIGLRAMDTQYVVPVIVVYVGRCENPF